MFHMSCSVRKIRPEDRPQVIELSSRLFEGMADWRDPEAVRTTIRSWFYESSGEEFDGDALVAEVDSTVVGFISVTSTTHFTGEVDGYVGELVVDAGFEGEGIGTALLRAAEQIAADAGYRCLTLTTGCANTRAIDFYHNLGFRSEDIKLTKVLATENETT